MFLGCACNFRTILQTNFIQSKVPFHATVLSISNLVLALRIIPIKTGRTTGGIRPKACCLTSENATV